MIYHTLIALTAVAKQNVEEFNKDKENFYKINGDMKEACHEKKETDLDAKAFITENPDFAIENFQLSSSDKIKIIEHAPKVFRQIRQSHLAEETLLEAVIPSANQKAIYNFEMGAGRSPSYFFFTDNSMIMIKTMKKEEAAILFDEEKGILLDYVKHVCENPDSLLSKFLGIYAV